MTRSYTIPRNFRRVVRRILGHGTYTCCQLSYDVGQRGSIAARNHAWNGPRIFILYAKWKTALPSHEPGTINVAIRREKLYENRSYVHAWPRSPADHPVARRSRELVEPPATAVALDHGRGPSPIAPPSGVRNRRRARDRAWRQNPEAPMDLATCGRSRPNGNPRGSESTYTSHARTQAGRNGTRPCRIRT